MTYEPMHSAQAQRVRVKEKISFGLNLLITVVATLQEVRLNVYFILVSESRLLQLMFMVLGWFNLLAALGITVWLATWVRQLYQGNCLQGQNPRQSPALDL